MAAARHHLRGAGGLPALPVSGRPKNALPPGGISLPPVAAARRRWRFADTAGVPMCQALYRVAFAYSLFGGGERREALRVLAAARRIAARRATSATLTLAHGLWRPPTPAGARPQGRARAARGCAEVLDGAKGGELSRAFWTPAFMARAVRRRARRRHRDRLRAAAHPAARPRAAARGAAPRGLAVPGEDPHARPLQRSRARASRSSSAARRRRSRSSC